MARVTADSPHRHTLSNQADSVTGKVEHKFTDNLSLTGSASVQSYKRAVSGLPPRASATRPGVEHREASAKGAGVEQHLRSEFDDCHDSASLLHELPAALVPLGAQGFDMASLGFPASYVNAVAAQKFPRVSVLNFGQVGGGALIGDAGYSYTRDSSYSFNGSLSKLVGRQTFKGGIDFRDLRRESASLGQTAGTFNFDPGWYLIRTRSRVDDEQRKLICELSHGAPHGQHLIGRARCRSTRRSRSLYATTVPTCRTTGPLSSKLTINYGLRYEWETGLREVDDRFLVAFDRTVQSPLAARTGLDLHGGLRYAGQDGFPSSQGDPSKKKFSPRLGLARQASTRRPSSGAATASSGPPSTMARLPPSATSR